MCFVIARRIVCRNISRRILLFEHIVSNSNIAKAECTACIGGSRREIVTGIVFCRCSTVVFPECHNCAGKRVVLIVGDSSGDRSCRKGIDKVIIVISSVCRDREGDFVVVGTLCIADGTVSGRVCFMDDNGTGRYVAETVRSIGICLYSHIVSVDIFQCCSCAVGQENSNTGDAASVRCGNFAADRTCAGECYGIIFHFAFFIAVSRSGETACRTVTEPCKHFSVSGVGRYGNGFGCQGNTAACGSTAFSVIGNRFVGDNMLTCIVKITVSVPVEPAVKIPAAVCSDLQCNTVPVGKALPLKRAAVYLDRIFIIFGVCIVPRGIVTCMVTAFGICRKSISEYHGTVEFCSRTSVGSRCVTVLFLSGKER